MSSVLVAGIGQKMDHMFITCRRVTTTLCKDKTQMEYPSNYEVRSLTGLETHRHRHTYTTHTHTGTDRQIDTDTHIHRHTHTDTHTHTHTRIHKHRHMILSILT